MSNRERTSRTTATNGRSVTDASKSSCAAAVGLHPTGDEGVTVITGACVSLVNVIVWVVVPILPQASVTVHVLVNEKEQPEPTSGPSVNVAVRPVEQYQLLMLSQTQL
ncbi:MAG: hypothetical protein IPP73_19995 [Chitinophagaceae bacterium]|nr:hypothetical protein [Chitinophagaceae bacterium]